MMIVRDLINLLINYNQISEADISLYRRGLWKKPLGFIGANFYDELTPKAAYIRLVICSLHFTADD